MKSILALFLALSVIAGCAPKSQPRYMTDPVPNAAIESDIETPVEQSAQVEQTPAPAPQSDGSCCWCWVFAPVKLILGVAAWTILPPAGATLVNIAIDDVLDE